MPAAPAGTACACRGPAGRAPQVDSAWSLTSPHRHFFLLLVHQAIADLVYAHDRLDISKPSII
ncbi:hypothetical protein [Streptomyces sp. NPDC002426]